MADDPDLRLCEYCGHRLELADFAGDAAICRGFHIEQAKRWDDANPDKIRHERHDA